MRHRIAALTLVLIAATLAVVMVARPTSPSSRASVSLPEPAPILSGDPAAAVHEDRRGNSRSAIAALATDAAPLPIPVSPAASIAAPLPDWDAPLNAVLPALRARADGGDIAAACHLGLALSACALTATLQPSPAALRSIDPQDRDAVDDLARASVDFMRPGREATCVGLSRADLDQRFFHLRAAAEAGNEAALLAYVEGVPLMSLDAMVRHPDWLDQYRRDAPRHVQTLLRLGNRRAAMLLSLGTDGLRVSLVSQALELDAVSSATLHELGRLVWNRMPTAQDGLFNAEQARVGRLRAQAIFARYFEQRPARSDEIRGVGDLMRVESCTASR